MEFTTIASLSLVILLLCIIYRFFSERFSYWKKVGINYIPATSPVGALGDIFFKPFHEILLERYKKYGRIYGLYEATRPVLSVADPDLLRDIFVKDFPSFTNRRDFSDGSPCVDNMVSILNGDKWKRVRTVMTPAFTTGKIKKMTSIILDSAKAASNNFEKAAKSGEPFDAKRLYGAFTMDVIARSAFATKIDSYNDPENAFLVAARKIFSMKFPLRLVLFLFWPSLFKFLGFSIFPRQALDFFKNVTLQIVQERRNSGQVHNDFLQLMMDASDEMEKGIALKKEDLDEEDTMKDFGHEESNGTIFKLSNYKGLSHDELLAQCILFFIAGYDTTASALSFATYFLALNPECQETLIAEIDDALRRNENQLTYEGVQSMKYMDSVICETLRFYPPATGLERMAVADYKLGDTGITITKGMIVTIPNIAIHHDPEFYPEPEKFDPNRFSAEEKAKRNPYTYLPFGAGPRNCLGMRFALMEIKICLAYLLSRFRFKTCPKTKVPLEFGRGQGLLQPKEILLSAEIRQDSVW